MAAIGCFKVSIIKSMFNDDIEGVIFVLHCSLPSGYDIDGVLVLKYLGFHVYMCIRLPLFPASITNPVVTVGLMLCFILLPIINHDFKIITNPFFYS
jgi:hypothetical protein